MDNTKNKSLKEHGTFNPAPDEVTDELFLNKDFFDPKDLIQVKYEMLRRVVKSGYSVARAAQLFGFSRTAFYQIQNAFNEKGLAGLLPHQRGPKEAHKLNDTVMNFVENEQNKNSSIKSQEMALLIKKEFGFTIHPRSIERAIERRKKNTKN